MSDTIEVEIPFMGFYESVHDDEIVRAVSSAFTMDHECDDEMTEEESGFLWNNRVVPWHEIQVEYSEEFTNALAEAIEIPLEYVTMQSPREYNFTTDRIFANMSVENFQKIRDAVESDGNWANVIRERFTSYSGFMSFYSNDASNEQWTRKDLDACQTRIYLEQYVTELLGEEWEYCLEVRAYELSSIDSMPNYEMAVAALAAE